MGSWYGTDALTQLAIKAGNPVLLFLLIPHRSSVREGGGGVTYTDDLYKPFGLPIRGRYADYGGINGIKESLFTKFLEDYFKKAYASKSLKLSDDYKRNGSADPAKASLSQYLKWVERGYVSVENKPVSFMLVLEKIYDAAMVKANEMGEYRWSNDENTLRSKFDESVGGLIKALHKEHKEGEDKIFGKVYTAAEQVWQFEFGNHLLRLNFQDWLRKSLASGKDISEAHDLIVDYIVFKEFMNRTRKLFTPQCGAGSQDDSVELQSAIAEMTLDICKRRMKESC